MKLIKRCYGCGKPIYPWQDIVRTKLVGRIHRGCATGARARYSFNILRETLNEVKNQCEELALKVLNKEERK